MKTLHKSYLLLLLCFIPQLSLAAAIDGATLSIWWGLPFAALLLSFAIVPVFVPIFWHHHYGKVILLWALAFVIPFIVVFGFPSMWGLLIHALFEEYVPFILLLLALFVVSGGIFIQTELRATPAINVGILAFGAVLASLMGTTGASMLLIRPLIRANAHRTHRVHTIIFFIFIVSNIGGSLTPLGDPPLFLGFLKGVSFFWTLQHLWAQTLFLIAVLLTLFFALDSWLIKGEISKGLLLKSTNHNEANNAKRFEIQGGVNFILLLCIVVLVLISGVWKPGVYFDIAGTQIALQNFVRDAGLLFVTIASMLVTRKVVRKANEFTWAPMIEIAKLFAGIFLTIVPVIAMLRAGSDGPFSVIVNAVRNDSGEPIPAMYFWATGALSSVLDNAPTYLVFFNTASGNAQVMMTDLSHILVAVSAGAVFMGANTYIGNAPNLMVKAIAQEREVRMPGFFGYMAWSMGILLPLFILVSWIWYR